MYNCAFAATGSQCDKPKPSSGFAASNLGKIKKRGGVHVSSVSKAVRSPEKVVPVTPEDEPQVVNFASFLFLIDLLVVLVIMCLGGD